MDRYPISLWSFPLPPLVALSSVHRGLTSEGRKQVDDLAGLDGRIEQLLASLDPLARQVAEMRFVAGVPQDEISTRLDLPPATVSSILRGALETMRHELDGQRGLAESQ